MAVRGRDERRCSDDRFTQAELPPRPRTSPRLLEKACRAALAALLLALVTGAWLAFFLLLPFEFAPPKIH